MELTEYEPGPAEESEPAVSLDDGADYVDARERHQSRYHYTQAHG
jgi:hypothetical protein